MNNGSVVTGSSVSSAVEYRGSSVLFPEETVRQSGSDSFDGFIDLFQGKRESEHQASDSELKSRDLFAVETEDVEREKVSSKEESHPEQNAVAAAEQGASVDSDRQSDNKSNITKQREGQAGQEQKRSDAGVKTDETDKSQKLSSTLSLRQQKLNGSTEKSEAKKIASSLGTTEPVKTGKQAQSGDTLKAKDSDGKTEKPKAAKESVQAGNTKSPASSEAKASTLNASKTANGDAKTDLNKSTLLNESKNSAQKTEHSAGKKETADVKAVESAKETGSGKKTTRIAGSSSAKTTQASNPSTVTSGTDEVRNALKPDFLTEEDRLKAQEREIGIKSATRMADKQIAMAAKEKTNENKGTSGFLKDSTEPASGNRTQTVTPRSDAGTFSNPSQSGNQDPSSGGREQFRQWITEGAETRNATQAAQQSQFIDRTTSSHLSVHVLNQIMNHIERLRESDKNRVKVTLGIGERGGISVDIKVEDGTVSTSFEGDESILRELKRDWRDISEKASKKGVTLNDPEFISYSSSVGGANSLPDSDTSIEEKSQSVIQHKDNQPRRPGEQTAATGGSGPVHSYA